MNRDRRRIVSLLPGATEWVCQLGLKDRLVGVSHECDYPPGIAKLPRVTRSRIDPRASGREIDSMVRSYSESRTPLYDLDSDTLVELAPDLIITQSLCNVCAVAERDVARSVKAMSGACQVLDLRAGTFDQVVRDAESIAQVTGSQPRSLSAIEALLARISDVRQRTARDASATRPVVTLLEWVEPLFCAGHWTPELIEWAGGDDPIGRSGQPSRVISTEQLLSANPDILLVACCGMDLSQTQRELANLELSELWSKLRCAESGWVRTFDGSALFNRPGPRLVNALESVAGIVRQWQNEMGKD